VDIVENVDEVIVIGDTVTPAINPDTYTA